jgi:hypothetical protein
MVWRFYWQKSEWTKREQAKECANMFRKWLTWVRPGGEAYKNALAEIKRCERYEQRCVKRDLLRTSGAGAKNRGLSYSIIRQAKR